MIEHLEWHNHAFIDENNIVINVAVFDENAHNSQLIEDVQQSLSAKQAICCCTFGMAQVGSIWTGTEFIPPSPYPSWIWDVIKKEWVAPISEPIDGGMYRWDEPTKSWIEIIVQDESTP